MVVIYVDGISDSFNKQTLFEMWQKLIKETHDRLYPTVSDIAIFFPRDQIQLGLGEEIVIRIVGMEALGLKVSEKVFKDLKNELVLIVKNYFVESLVQVF